MENENGFKNSYLLIGTGILLLCYNLFIRFTPLNGRTLEYDEIYTIINFVPLSFQQIFTDVATPNNHMLHTLAVKLCKIPDSVFFTASTRFPAALAGLLSIFLFIPFRKHFQSIYGVLFAILLFAFNGAHIHFSQTARGYSLLTFFLLLATFSLLEYEKTERENPSRKKLLLWAIFYFLSACAASVSVSSGVIFVFAVSLVFLLFTFPYKNWKKEWKILQYLFYAFTAVGIFILSYFLPNAAKFAQGSNSFGVKYTSCPQIISFLYAVLHDNDLIYPLLVSCAGAYISGRSRKKILWLLFSAFTVLLITLLTRNGPSRVYLPLCAFLLPAAAMGLENIVFYVKEKYFLYAKEKENEEKIPAGNKKLLSFLLFLLLFIPVFFAGNTTHTLLTPYDMNLLYHDLDKNPLLTNVMPVFSSTDSVALRSLHDRNAARKLLSRVPHTSALLFTFPLNTLHTMERNKETTSSMPLPKLEKPAAEIFTGRKFLPLVPLQKVTKPYRKDEVIFLLVFLVEKEYIQYVKVIQSLKGFRHLNYLQTIDDPTLYAGLLAAKAEEVTLSPEEMLSLEEKTNGRIRFRLLQKAE
ncbi:MAG: phospholipid carrier-dependent glycosyltransferase [Lentisphaeria bacterium]|nr:phospholipid carrier-dependent glycosyltransferase [Lentisphaeria bacterium]